MDGVKERRERRQSEDERDTSRNRRRTQGRPPQDVEVASDQPRTAPNPALVDRKAYFPPAPRRLRALPSIPLLRPRPRPGRRPRPRQFPLFCGVPQLSRNLNMLPDPISAVFRPDLGAAWLSLHPLCVHRRSRGRRRRALARAAPSTICPRPSDRTSHSGLMPVRRSALSITRSASPDPPPPVATRYTLEH